MCGRFTLRSPPHVLAQQGDCQLPPDLPPRFNIAPTQSVAAIRIGRGGQRECVLLRWGLIPSWAHDPRIGARLINARAETVAEKPAFRAAFQRRRCLVLADGYYEWKKTARGKQPFFIRLPHDQPFALAGLWESWRHPATHQTIESCTVLTTAAPPEMLQLHPRMPVILPDQTSLQWLEFDPHDRQMYERLLQAVDPRLLRIDPVDTWVNNPRNEGPRCLTP